VRDLPRAIAISCVLCLVIYVLTVVAFHTTLSTYEVLGSEAVAVTFANRLYGKGGGALLKITLPFKQIFNVVVQ
jgi:amino acid transporter